MESMCWKTESRGIATIPLILSSILFLVAALLMSGCDTGRVEKLERHAAQMESQIDGLRSEVYNLDSQVADLESRLDDLEAEH